MEWKVRERPRMVDREGGAAAGVAAVRSAAEGRRRREAARCAIVATGIAMDATGISRSEGVDLGAWEEPRMVAMGVER